MSDPKVDPRARLRHDLRTPLHQIIGYAELLEDEVRDAGQEKFLADLGKIREAARKALEAVDEAVPPTAPSSAPLVFREPEPPAAGGPEDPPPTIPIAPVVRLPAAPLDPGAVRLLVVDDNELNRDMLSRRLGGRGFAVEIAEDGERALARIEQQAFDLVLLDVMMPGLLGHRRAAPPARALAGVGPAGDHGHRARLDRGRGGGARASGRTTTSRSRSTSRWCWRGSRRS